MLKHNFHAPCGPLHKPCCVNALATTHAEVDPLVYAYIEACVVGALTTHARTNTSAVSQACKSHVAVVDSGMYAHCHMSDPLLLTESAMSQSCGPSTSDTASQIVCTSMRMLAG